MSYLSYEFDDFDSENQEIICKGIGCYYSFEKTHLFIGVVDETKKLTIIQEEIRTQTPIEDVAELINELVASNNILNKCIFINPHRAFKLSLKIKEIEEINLSDESAEPTQEATDIFKSLKAKGRLELGSQIQELNEPMEPERIYAIKLLVYGLKVCLYGTSGTEEFEAWLS